MDNEIDIISYMKKNMVTFSKRQKIIALYILENYDKAAYMTAAKLSEEVGVSESTVVRFAAELGFDGYQKLQNTLQEVTRTKLTSVQRMEIASRRIGDGDILTDVLQSDIEKIQKTLSEIDNEQFNGVVNAIVNAKNIYIMGVRSSASLAMFASFYLNLIFDNVRAIHTTSSSDVFEQIFRIDEDDVIFGISFPRYSKNTIEALQYAKTKGATIIGLTDCKHSPIVKESDYCLLARSDMASFVDSLVAPFSVMNALIVALGIRQHKEVSQTFGELESIWDEYNVYDKRNEEKKND